MDNCIPRLIIIEVLSEPSIDQHMGISVVTTLELSWMDPIIAFLAEDILPNEAKEKKKVRRIAAHFGCPKTGDYTEGHLVDLICYASTH